MQQPGGDRRKKRDRDESVSAASADWGARVGAIYNGEEDEEAEEERSQRGGYKSKKQKNGKSVNFSEVLKIADENRFYASFKGNEGECRACRMGYFVTNNKLPDAIGLLVKRYAYAISVPALIEEVYLLGEAERKNTIEELDEDPGEWTREDVEHHLFYCMTDMNLWVLKEINDLKRLLQTLKDKLYIKNADTGEIEVDKDVWRLMMQAQTQLKHLWTVLPEKAVSFNPKLAVHSSKRKLFKE